MYWKIYSKNKHFLKIIFSIYMQFQKFQCQMLMCVMLLKLSYEKVAKRPENFYLSFVIMYKISMGFKFIKRDIQWGFTT